MPLNVQVPSREVRPDELVLPGQRILLVIEAPAAAAQTIANAVAGLGALTQLAFAFRGGRLGVYYLPIVAIRAQAIRGAIAGAVAGLAVPAKTALYTIDFGELHAEALADAIGTAIEIATFVPRAAGAAAGRLLQRSGAGIIGGAVIAVVVIGGAVYALSRR